MAKRNVEMVAPRTGSYNSPSDLQHIYVPQTIYYYHVKSTTIDGHTRYDEAVLFIREVGTPITLAMLKSDHIPQLTRNARSQTPDNPKSSGKGFGRVPWRRRSYLVVALDDNGTGNGFETDNAVEIARKNGDKRSENHCFFDGGDEQIPVPAEGGSGPNQTPIWVMWTVNYMKNRTGKDIPEGRAHNFAFKFNLEGRPIIVPEDSGTNMGPPVPPP